MHEFEAPIVSAGDSIDFYTHVVWVPDEIAEALQANGDRRFVGTIGGVEFGRTLHPHDDGTYLVFGKSWLREASLDTDVPLEVKIEPDPNPDQVDVPEELEAALEFEPMALEEWNRMTPGKQRSYSYQVKRGKKMETRVNRALKIAEDLKKAALQK